MLQKALNKTKSLVIAHTKVTLNLTLAAHVDTLLRYHTGLTTNGWTQIKPVLDRWEQQLECNRSTRMALALEVEPPGNGDHWRLILDFFTARKVESYPWSVNLTAVFALGFVFPLGYYGL